MLKGSRKYWAMAILCGTAAAFLFYMFVQDVKTQYQPDDLISVARARVDITRDTLITEEMIEMIPMPQKYAHPQAVRNPGDIIGRIAAGHVSSAEIILESKVVDSSSNKDRLAYQVPASKRAVAIGVDSISGVAGYLQEGDRVDIFATVDLDDPSGSAGATSFTVLTLQDIMVLAVGSSTELDQKKSGTGGRTITLALAPQEASALILASERGTLRLALRSPVDRSLTSVPPFQLRDLLAQVSKP